jgi:signal transduction histidine kinase
MKTMSATLMFVAGPGEFLHLSQKSIPSGCSAECVADVERAVQSLSSSDYDIVMMNAELPGVAGLLDWLRRNRPCTVAVLLLAEDSPTTAGLQAVAFDCLYAPFDATSVGLCVQRAIQLRRALLAEREARLTVDRLNRQLADRVKSATCELLVANEHLSAANHAKDRFLAAMSHELRTPLTAITGAVRVLQSPKISGDKAHSILEMLDRNVWALKRLLDDLFDCSRIATGKLSVEMEPTNLNDCVSAAVETMRGKACEAQVKLDSSIPETPCIVNGNPLRLQQVAWNLIDNAIKFTAPDGHIAVSVSQNGANVDLIVCDSGVGLSADDIQRIFEPFAQAGHDASHRKGGLGLGLALVRNLTEMHRGTVRVESDGPGNGSRFIVSLPLESQQRPAHQVA